MFKRSKPLLLAAVFAALALALGASSAFAETACSTCRPWWHLNSSTRPAALQPGSKKGQVVLTAANLGDAPIGGLAGPVTIAADLPAGLNALSVEATSGEAHQVDGPVSCSLKLKPHITCTFEGTLPPYEQIEVGIGVEVKAGAEAGEPNQLSVSGGGAAPAAISRPIALSEEPTPFGIEAYELDNEEVGGGADTQAGSHPFQLTTTIALNQRNAPLEEPAALTKDLSFRWPPGLLGNPTPLSRCSLLQFYERGSANVYPENGCPLQSIVGVAMVTYIEPLGETGKPLRETITAPVYNLEPTYGEPARFGFLVPVGAVLLEPAVRSGPGADYGITVTVPNITEVPDFLSSKVTVWGTPGDPRHDLARGQHCLGAAHGAEENGIPITCKPLEQAHPLAFVTLPTACTGAALETSAIADSWTQPGVFTEPFVAAPTMPAVDGCNQLVFAPTISAQPSTDRASAPSGLDFNVDFHDEGFISGTGTAQSQLKDTVVTLPEGFTINPSAGVGLAGCTPADYARETLDSEPGAGCPNESKLGTVEVISPALSTPLHGSLFIAQPYENPFPEPEQGHPNGTLVALYIVLKNPETGILIKLAGKATPNPVTGQLTTTFDNNPQLPFDHFNFHFREGQQAPLISPPACGSYTTQAQLTPWSEPTKALSETSSFTISKGFDGGACPSGGVPPFHPGIQSGTLNNNAGAFSPFYVHLTRTDGEQEISEFSTNLPPGLTGDLSGIPFCPEADIAAARHKTGAQEQAEPSCPAGSEIGHTLVGTGVGAVLAYVPGKIYLAGPYHGAPLSIVSVTSAVVGPFDLGTVVIRFGLNIDPITAQVSVSPSSSEPIPTIIDGIVTHVRDIRVYISRPGFILNPTSCDPLAISSTLSSNLGASTTVSSPFQAASCSSLAFKPTFKATSSAKTSRANGESLHVAITYPNAPQGTQANIKSVKVDLPRQLPSRLTTLQKACVAKVFEANPSACPAASRVGSAKAVTPILPVPLEGPAYFVSYGDLKFPELIIVLQGYGFTIYLHGETFISKTGITSSTFRTVPDQPFSSFELTLPQGPYSALASNGNLCKVKGGLKMPTALTAQNGTVIKQSTPIAVTGCPKAKKASKAVKHNKKSAHKKKK